MWVNYIYTESAVLEYNILMPKNIWGAGVNLRMQAKCKEPNLQILFKRVHIICM